ncbi:MAG: DUF4340 domain-containing protein [Treponema sp.]|nr:DUF4340 domain-containing protein [Treponema sp.]
MKKRTRRLFLPVLLVLAAALGAGAFLLVRLPVPDSGETVSYLFRREPGDIQTIHVTNSFGETYEARLDGDAPVIGDIPAGSLNREYALMLFDEAARIEFRPARDTIEGAGDEANEKRKRYGFLPPRAEVTVRCRDGETFSFLVGEEETISGGRYLLPQSGEQAGQVFLIDNARTIRFVMPLARYVNYEIVPFIKYQSPLSAVKRLELGGRAFPRPIVIEAVLSGDKEALRDAASFGAVTHLIRSPALHEIDQKEGIEVFASLTGLLNRDVMAWNVPDTMLDELGFNDPWVRAEFDAEAGEGEPLTRILLRVVRRDGEWLLVRDDQRVIHRIEPGEAFLNTSYEKLVTRWFLTPLITDLAFLELTVGADAPGTSPADSGGGKHRFVFSGESSRELAVSLDGGVLDIALFRKFYSLLISAGNDGVLLENPVMKGPPLLVLRFEYRDPLKAPDTMKLYEGDIRRYTVEVNGLAEFAMTRRYLSVVKEAFAALRSGKDFSTAW